MSSGYDRSCRFNAPALPRSGRGSVVGASIFQTPGAQAREMGQIDADMRTFSGELTGAARARGYDVHDPATEHDMAAADPRGYMLAIAHDAAKPLPNDPIVHMFRDVWTPFARKWGEFYKAYGDGRWWSNPAAEAEGYHRQLVQLRATAEALGLHLTSPHPEQFSPSFLDPHHDITDTAAAAAKKAAEDLWKLGKTIIYGGLGLVGLVAIGSLVSHARSGSDPAQSYIGVARQLRSGRS